MTEQQPLLKTELTLPPFIKGKVRDTYDLGKHLLIVATDRISVFDVILPDGIPDKGRVLNLISAFWFEETASLLPNHVIKVVDDPGDLDTFVPVKSRAPFPNYLAGRSMVVKKADRISLEWVIRGYLSGSAWEEYKKSGTVGGTIMPKGLQESQEFPEPLFTPTSKADTGHDEPISIKQVDTLIAEALTGGDTYKDEGLRKLAVAGRLEESWALTKEMKEKSLAIYKQASDHARKRGIIIADTKMEFGLDNGKLILIDELLTPDSSRFWDAEKYKVGQSQLSFDKQPVRDWTAATGWNKEPPAPHLTQAVIEATTARYREAYKRITGKELP